MIIYCAACVKLLCSVWEEVCIYCAYCAACVQLLCTLCKITFCTGNNRAGNDTKIIKNSTVIQKMHIINIIIHSAQKIHTSSTLCTKVVHMWHNRLSYCALIEQNLHSFPIVKCAAALPLKERFWHFLMISKMTLFKATSRSKRKRVIFSVFLSTKRNPSRKGWVVRTSKSKANFLWWK